MKLCKYCNQEITWAKEAGKFIPMNPDGTRHNCRKQESKPATSGISAEMEGRIRQISREVAEQVFKENIGS